MMTSTSKFSFVERFPALSSREIGNEALALIIVSLGDHDVVELDFGGKPVTPSFADQCIGGLASRLGLDEFKRRVKIRNAAEESVPLIKHVILSRSAHH